MRFLPPLQINEGKCYFIQKNPTATSLSRNIVHLFWIIQRLNSQELLVELLSAAWTLTLCVSCLSGGCKWIRTPAIVYSTHVATTLVPILAHILFYQFPMKPHPGPQTLQERWLLVSIYAPYLVVPVLLLLTMLLSSTYNSTSVPGRKSAKAKKN